jgi:acyl carrier protein
MQNLISEDRVIAEIMKIAVETLRVPEGKATADSSFVRDLGAESLDFLDIDYRLEQAFGI